MWGGGGVGEDGEGCGLRGGWGVDGEVVEGCCLEGWGWGGGGVCGEELCGEGEEGEEEDGWLNEHGWRCEWRLGWEHRRITLEGGGQGCRVGVCGRPLGRADLGRGYNLHETSSPLSSLEPVSSLRAV